MQRGVVLLARRRGLRKINKVRQLNMHTVCLVRFNCPCSVYFAATRKRNGNDSHNEGAETLSSSATSVLTQKQYHKEETVRRLTLMSSINNFSNLLLMAAAHQWGCGVPNKCRDLHTTLLRALVISVTDTPTSSRIRRPRFHKCEDRLKKKKSICHSAWVQILFACWLGIAISI